MVMLVSLQQATDHLRVGDSPPDEADIILKIKAASAMILAALGDVADFLDSDGEVELDGSDNPEGVPEEVQQATLLLLGNLYDTREGGEGAFKDGDLPPSVKALLNSAGRVPPIA